MVNFLIYHNVWLFSLVKILSKLSMFVYCPKLKICVLESNSLTRGLKCHILGCLAQFQRVSGILNLDANFHVWISWGDSGLSKSQKIL